MTSNIQTYSPEDVSLIIGTSYKLEDWDSITLQVNEPAFRLVKGINNKNTRVKVSDYSATITVSLLQTSPSNYVLSEINRNDMLHGTGRLDVLLKDTGGQTQFSSFEAYIEGLPVKKYGMDIELVDWTIICQSIDNWGVGGNLSLSENVLSQISRKITNLF